MDVHFRLVIHKQHSNRIEVEYSRKKMKGSIDRNRVAATESTEQQNPTRTRKIFGKHYNGIASMNHHNERELTERMMCEIERETLRPFDDQYQLIHSILAEIFVWFVNISRKWRFLLPNSPYWCFVSIFLSLKTAFAINGHTQWWQITLMIQRNWVNYGFYFARITVYHFGFILPKISAFSSHSRFIFSTSTENLSQFPNWDKYCFIFHLFVLLVVDCIWNSKPNLSKYQFNQMPNTQLFHLKRADLFWSERKWPTKRCM